MSNDEQQDNGGVEGTAVMTLVEDPSGEIQIVLQQRRDLKEVQLLLGVAEQKVGLLIHRIEAQKAKQGRGPSLLLPS